MKHKVQAFPKQKLGFYMVFVGTMFDSIFHCVFLAECFCGHVFVLRLVVCSFFVVDIHEFWWGSVCKLSLTRNRQFNLISHANEDEKHWPTHKVSQKTDALQKMTDVKSFRSFYDVILLKRKSYPFVTGPQDRRYHGELARREVLKLALESQHVPWPHKVITGELWGQFTSDMDMVRFLSHDCLRQAYERNIVSFESNLLDSLSIVLYVRKNVVAFYGPIFASCTSVPQKKMS